MAYCFIKMMCYNTCISMKLINQEEKRKKQYDDIEKEKSHLNKNYTADNDYIKMYNKVMQNDYYTKPDKYGRTHKEPKIKAIGFITTFSPEVKDKINLDIWVNENIEYFKNLFPDCPLSVTLHLDQTTPHLHVFVIPVTKSGKISKSSFINGKKDMFQLQDTYADSMKKFGLERGIHKEKKDKNHTSEQQITKYKKIKNANMKLKKDNAELTEKINQELDRYDCIGEMCNELETQKEQLQNDIKTLEKQKNALQYDVKHLADSILNDEYTNPFTIENGIGGR